MYDKHSCLSFFIMPCCSVPLELFTTWGHGDNSKRANVLEPLLNEKIKTYGNAVKVTPDRKR